MSASSLRKVLLLTLLLPLAACSILQSSSGGEPARPDVQASQQQEYVADLMLAAGRVGLAADGYAKALAARPNDARLRVKHGRALLRLDMAEAAWPEFRAALAADQTLAEGHHGAGLAALRLGRLAEAREAFVRAVTLAPESWRSRCQLGVALLHEKRSAEAREQFLAALALPDSIAGRDVLLNNLGLAQAQAGEFEAAERTLRLALRESRNPEQSANNLGVLLVRLGRPADALAAFRAGGNDARALNNLGYALYLAGDTDKARALFEKALDLAPRYYEAAGENLKLAVRESSARPAPAPEPATVPAQPAREVSRPEGQGAAFDVSRMSLTGEEGLRCWRASLLSAGGRLGLAL